MSARAPYNSAPLRSPYLPLSPRRPLVDLLLLTFQMLFRAAKELDPALIPDDLTIPQFILNAHTDSNRPTRDARADTWLIQDKTGRRIGLDELKRRTNGLANALSLQYGVKSDDAGE